jgi:hypothetical protein
LSPHRHQSSKGDLKPACLSTQRTADSQLACAPLNCTALICQYDDLFRFLGGGSQKVKKRPRCVPVEKRTITSRSVQSEAGFRSSPVLAYGALRSDIGHRSSSGVSIRPSPSPRNKVNNAPNPEGYGIASRSSSIYSHKRASLSTPTLRPDTVVMRDVLKFPSFLLGEEDVEIELARAAHPSLV